MMYNACARQLHEARFGVSRVLFVSVSQIVKHSGAVCRLGGGAGEGGGSNV